MQNDYVDISFTVLDRVRQGRRLLRDLKTGQIYYDPLEPVEPLPEASVEQPSADPAPPLVDLLGIREKELDEAGKPLGAKIDAEVFAIPEPQTVKPARKPKAKRLLHG